MPKRPAASKKEGPVRPTALSRLSLDALLARTRDELDAAARRLGLSGLGRLKREDLARRVHGALQKAASARPAVTAVPRAKGAPSAAERQSGRGKKAAGKQPKTPARKSRLVPPSTRTAKPRPRPARKREEPEPETGARSKFDVGSRVPEPRPAEHIPWGYGHDRVTIMPIDPRRLYAYWELRDDSIEESRRALGKGGRDAWLNLRVYDITGRIFDGTNAHSYFDQKVDRDTRQWFFDIGKPTSTHCVEVGLKSYEGYFVKVARSGRADFPPAEPWSPGPVEWLGVHEGTGEVGAPAPGQQTSSAPSPAHAAHAAPKATAPGEGGGTEGEYWVVSDTPGFHEWALRSGWESQDFERTGWIGGHGRLEWFGTGQRFEWVGPVVKATWESGPFPVPVEAPGVVEERHEGPVLVQKTGERTRVIYGPWEVVIRGIGGRAEGRVLARWEVRKYWVSDGGFEAEGGTLRWPAPGASEALLAGASERRWRIGSDVRLAGASELFRVGASELRLLGASEVRKAGASEGRYRGASERGLRGASERLVRGASEHAARGASEKAAGGASERLVGFASERAGRGASEGRLAGGGKPKGSGDKAKAGGPKRS